MDTFFIIAQVLGFIACIFGVLTFQVKGGKSTFLTLSLICTVFYFASDCFLQAWAGAGVCAVAVLRMFVFLILDKKKIENNLLALLILEALFVIVSIITWQNFWGLLPLAGNLFFTWGAWQKKTFWLYFSNLVTSVFCIVYNLIYQGYTVVLLESFVSISCIIGIIRLIIFAKKQGLNFTTIDK